MTTLGLYTLLGRSVKRTSLLELVLYKGRSIHNAAERCTLCFHVLMAHQAFLCTTWRHMVEWTHIFSPFLKLVRLRYYAVRSAGSSVPTPVRFRCVLRWSPFLYLQQTTETFSECNLSLYKVFQVTNARHSTSLTDGCSAQDWSYRLNYKCSSPTILGRLSELTTSWYKIDILHLYAYRTAKLITARGDLQQTAYNEETEIQN